MVLHQDIKAINIIASNPTGDEDFACAEYIRDLILGSKPVDIEQIKARIVNSYAAKKFFDEKKSVELFGFWYFKGNPITKEN